MQPGGGDLVEQRLERVVVALVDRDDVVPAAGEVAHEPQPTEAGTHDDDLERALHGRPPRVGRVVQRRMIVNYFTIPDRASGRVQEGLWPARGGRIGGSM
jgi:hypothetical protein